MRRCTIALVELERGNAVDEQTARARLRFKYRDRISQLRQLIGARQSAGTATGHRHLEPVWGGPPHRVLMRERVFVDEFLDGPD